jgi:tetratricopeptide (TPR) repeat protein
MSRLTTQLTIDSELTAAEGHGLVAVGMQRPPVIGGPAKTETASAHTSTQADRERLNIGNSPLIEVVTLSTGFARRTPNGTPCDPASHILWRTHIDANHLADAAAVCAERQLLSETLPERACWFKDLAIVRMAEGRFREAFELLRPVRAVAPNFKGSFRARVETVLARSHEHLRDFDPAFDHYTAARIYAAADSHLAAQIDTNTGRCYTSAGRAEDSYDYFDRAEAFALKSNDTLLQAEIDESRALAFESEGRFREGLVAAAHSLLLLAPTDYRLARAESKATYERIERRLT